MLASGVGFAPAGSAALDTVACHSSFDEPPAPDPELDAAERALLLQIYRELVGTVEGPVVPFPVELMADPAERAERPDSALVVDLGEFRTRRQAERTPDPGDPR